MNDNRKSEIVRKVRGPINDLIAIDQALYREGFCHEADVIGNIIRRLEAFERRHTNISKGSQG